MSHDDTFEADAENCVRIEKDERGSHVTGEPLPVQSRAEREAAREAARKGYPEVLKALRAWPEVLPGVPLGVHGQESEQMFVSPDLEKGFSKTTDDRESPD